MLGRLVCLICFVVILGLVGGASAGVPEGAILIGWHSPEIASPTNDSTPDDFLPGVEGLLSGGYDVQNKNSTDGTYGSGPATPASTVNAVRVRLDQPSRAFALVRITNRTGGSLYLGVFHFDYGRWYDASPKDVALYYDSGDLTTDPNTVIGSASNLPVSGASGDYSDFDWNLSVLNDVVLENGQSATFRLQISNATSAATAGGLDNIAITAGVSATKASDPRPADGAIDIPRELLLSWMRGEFADKHDVYFGNSFADVNNATNLDPMGPDRIYRARQGGTSYAVPERLDFRRTYYWRVDEVNAPPNSNLVFTGDVWSFTTEPYAYPVDNITATASSENKAVEGPGNTINGSGLDSSDLHSYENTTMWLSSITGPQPTWIQYEFDKTYKLHQMWVWNYNSTTESAIGYGIKEAIVEYSVDGINWATLGSTHEFAPGPGADGYACNTTIDFEGVVAKYVKITANSNWKGLLKQYGLSEVRFLYVPVWATRPSPDSGAADANVDAVLNFKAGREAATHSLYLSTDSQAVIDGTVPPTTLKATSYSATLDLGSTYYWRVDEVNDVETPTTWRGDVWSFSTSDSLVVDDFESYNDIDPPDSKSHRIFESWIDGFAAAANGALVGYDPPQPSYAEKTIVHGGVQSMPLFYSNTSGATYSEATRTFAISQNWTKYGIRTLGLWFYGTTGNSGQLYVKINGVKVPYDGDAGNLAVALWRPWNIDLTTLGVNLQSVTTLAIGIDGNAAAGTLYVDDIRLYPHARQLITPVQPDPNGLTAQYPMEGNANDIAGANNGTLLGGPVFAAGNIGQAIQFDGVDDYVDCGKAPALDIRDTITLSCWIKVAAFTKNWETILAKGDDSYRMSRSATTGNSVHFGCNGPTGANLNATVIVTDDNWHHVACVYDGADKIIYIDGSEDVRLASTGQIALSTNPLWIGNNSGNTARQLGGLVDDVRIYSRPLSAAEVAGLAGRTQPFDKAF